MDLPILAVAAVGLAALSVSGGAPDDLQLVSTGPAPIEGPANLVGQRLWASEEPLALWNGPLRAEDLALEDLGTVAGVVTGPEGEASRLVVAVGGLWGMGAQQVELGLERVHVLPAADGGQRLVVDLSAAGAEPPTDGAEL